MTTYFWKNLECELCKTAYPSETKSLDGKSIKRIVEYDTPRCEKGRTGHYIVLESISSNTSKVIHVVNMERTDNLFIGRGHDAHVRVTDISVSRLHALLVKSVTGYYYLADNESKFGTLALVRNPIKLNNIRTQCVLQMGRSLLDFRLHYSYRNLIKSCLCVNRKSKKKGDQDELISMDGLGYFPRQLASGEFVKELYDRKSKN